MPSKTLLRKNGPLFLCVLIACDLLAGTGYTALFPEIRVESKVFDHGLRPNTRAVEHWGARKNLTVTNSLGFRDFKTREISLKKTGRRIILIGDSFTEGIGVGYEKTFAGILTREFQPQGTEVLNAAAASSYPKIYLDKLRYFIDKGLEADEVVVFLDISDIPDEVDGLSFLPQSLHTPKIEIRTFLENHSLFCRFLFTAKYKYFVLPKIEAGLLKRNKERALWPQNLPMFQEYGIPGLKLASLHLDELLRYLKSKNIKMTLAVYPWPPQIQAGHLDSPQVLIWKRWCEERNVPFINYFPYFLKLGSAADVIREYYIPGDVHWNEAGHKYVAEIFLKERNEAVSPGA